MTSPPFIPSLNQFSRFFSSSLSYNIYSSAFLLALGLFYGLQQYTHTHARTRYWSVNTTAQLMFTKKAQINDYFSIDSQIEYVLL